MIYYLFLMFSIQIESYSKKMLLKKLYKPIYLKI